MEGGGVALIEVASSRKDEQSTAQPEHLSAEVNNFFFLAFIT